MTIYDEVNIMKKKSIYRLIPFVLILFLLSGCGKQLSDNGASDERVLASPSSSSQEITSNANVSAEPNDDKENKFVFKGEVMQKVEKPDKIEVIAQIRSQMGEKPVTLNDEQADALIQKINALKLKEYEFKKSDVEIPDGGGILVQCYYADKKLTFDFTSSDLIEKQESGKESHYFKDDSGKYQELEKYLTTILAS